MNGVPAIMLMISMAVTALGSLFDGKKRTAMTAIGLTTALAACVAAAKQENDRKQQPALATSPVQSESDLTDTAAAESVPATGKEPEAATENQH